jgi:serine protease inhibitor
VENSADPLHIASARQLVKLDMNEQGTEMAAVTYAMAKCNSAPPRQEKKNTFRAERPYVMVLFDRTTKAVLLSGVICDPVRNRN